MIFSKRKTIGVFISKVFKVFDEAFFSALDEESRRLDYDIVVFITAGYYLATSAYDIQEKNILKFVPGTKLDGIIAVPSSYEEGELRDKTNEMLEKKMNCPIVVVREENDTFNCVYTNNNAAVRNTIRHLIEHHGLTKICYQAGGSGNPEMKLRLEAFRQEMEAHGLEVSDKHICGGTMWTNCGDMAYDAFFSDPDDIPQAVACGNDYMAMGLTRVLRKNGYRVPEDVIVTGFDNVTDWCTDIPSLTTVQPDYHGMVTNAMELLDKMIKEKAVPDEPVRIGLPGKLVLGESCGCGKRPEDYYKRLTEKTMALLEDENDQDAAMNNMSIDLGGCDDLTALHEVMISKRTVNPIVRDHYICLFGTAEDPLAGTGDEACLVHAYRDHVDSGMPMITFDRKNILPMMAERRDEAQVFYLKLLHHMGHDFGYSVFHYDRGKIPSRCFVQTNVLLSIALENIRRRNELLALYEERRLSSITDPLTGLLNRRGMLEYVEPVWRSLIGREIAFICIDLDRLKRINDTYGHGAGDFAIRLVGKAVQESLPEGAIGVRMSGDEFIVFLPDAGGGVADTVISTFYDNLEILNKEADRTFRVSASAGYEIITPGSTTTIDECIHASDRALYRTKERHHAEEGAKRSLS